MYKKALARVTPESVGLSSRTLLKMVQELDACGTEMHGLMVARHGKVCLEGWWTPYTAELPHICHSFGKSYVGTAVGLACTEGYLSVNDRIADILADELKAFGVPDEGNLSRLTIRHVLMMANGMSVHAPSGANLLRNYLTCKVDREPGSVFMYNTTGSCMLGAAVMKKTGKTVREYLTRGVFEKIGLETDKLEWMAFHENGVHAAPGVAATTENNLRLGMLYLNNGCWDGEQLIDAAWMHDATTRQIRTDVINAESHLDNGAGYGYQLWICPEKDTFKFAGGHGQDTIMSRPNDLVIAINQAASDVTGDAENAVLSRYLLAPALDASPLPEDPEGEQALRDYMATRRVKDNAPCAAEDLSAWQGIYHVTAGQFHVSTELRPMDDSNVYTDFYDHEDVMVRDVSIAVCGDDLEVVLDDGTIRTRLLASTDGVLRPVPTQGAIPVYRSTVSTVSAPDADTLIIDTKFLQTCFWTRMTLHRTPNAISVNVRKERLHESLPYFFYNAEMRRVK